MSENAKGLELLNQLERILDCDPHIDEIGIVHPSQFATLKEAADSSVSSEDASVNESTNFWNRDHKLGISTLVLIPLYKAARDTFMAALKKYKTLSNLPGNVEVSVLESEIMIHSKALLILSCDFGTAWNSRKLIVLKKQLLPMFTDELFVSALVLSYAPKSDRAWGHRRWVINSLSGKCSNLQQIIEKESELVETIAENSKMNYRAWNHRCWLVSFMTREQVLHQLEKSRNWASLHVADSSCFHYRRRLMLRILKDLSDAEAALPFHYNLQLCNIWKEELDWNEALINRYVGREALWLHRRFLSSYWITHMAAGLQGVLCQSERKTDMETDVGSFINHELCLVDSCSTIPDSEFEDFQAQATHSATYLLWLTKQISKSIESNVEEEVRARNLHKLLNLAWPERSSFWNWLVDA